MQTYTTVAELKQALDIHRKQGRSIGFVPTMGALHAGHASLIEATKDFDDINVCSIFVNPKQFNDKKDLIKYPRTLDADAKLLESVGTHILFVPSVDEIYPKGMNTRLKLNLGHLAETMEGKFRPGHFEGMLQVVKRLLDIVNPDHLYMGQKDFQQFTIVQHMIDHFHMDTILMVCPIIREADGLAMSSRNVRLTDDFRKKAVVLSKTLKWAKSKVKSMPIKLVKKEAMDRINGAGLKAEYFEIVDGYKLKSIQNIKPNGYYAACTAAWAGEVRLIDNMIF